MKYLRASAIQELGKDYSEQNICGENKFAVDYYFREESTIVEIALSLRNPQSEFERDIFKALIAKENGNPVTNLLFITKPGGHKRISQPSARAISKWVERKHGVTIDVVELKPKLDTQ